MKTICITMLIMIKYLGASNKAVPRNNLEQLGHAEQQHPGEPRAAEGRVSAITFV